MLSRPRLRRSTRIQKAMPVPTPQTRPRPAATVLTLSQEARFLWRKPMMRPMRAAWKARPAVANPPTAMASRTVEAKAATEARGRSLRETMARGTAVATWKKSWKTGVTAAMRPKVTARPESAPAVATSTGVRRRASRAWLLMCLVSQAPPTSATAAGCRP